MDLSALGALVTIAYIIGIFAFQWVTDWYFNASHSLILDSIASGLKDLDDSIDEDEEA
jgi:hypothetical protein